MALKISKPRLSLFVITLFACFLPVADQILQGPLTSNLGDDGHHVLALYSLTFSIFALISSRYISDQWLDFYPLFILATLLFNLSFQGLQAMGLVSLQYDFLGRGVDFQRFARATTYTIFLIGAFHAGALLFFKPSHNNGPAISNKSASCQADLNQGKVFFITGIFFFLIAMPGAIPFFLGSIKAVISGGYGVFMSSEVFGLSSWKSRLAGFLVPSIFLLLLAGRAYRAALILSFLCMVAFLIVYFLIGRRAFPVMLLLSYIVILDLYIKRIPRVWVALSGIMLLMIFPIIASSRGSGSLMSLSLQSFANYDLIQLPVDAVMEMGLSFRVMYWSTELLDGNGGYLFGSTYLWSLTSVIPNLFWAYHPSVGTGVGDLLTATFRPDLVAKGGASGIGSSFLAEAYLNFGLILGAAFCFLLGASMQRFIHWAKNGSVARLFLLGAFFASAFILARGEAQSIMRDVFWYMIFPYLLFLFLWQYLYLRSSS